MLSSLFVVGVSRVLVSSTLLFFGSAKPCTDHSAVTVITGPQEPAFLLAKEKRFVAWFYLFSFPFSVPPFSRSSCFSLFV